MFRTAAVSFTAFMALTVSAQAAGTTLVRETQERLIGLGYYVGSVDGVMGHQTISALIDFQGRVGLPTSGKITSETNRELAQATASNWRPNFHGTPYYAYNGYSYSYYNGAVSPAEWRPVDRSLMRPIPNRFVALSVMEERNRTASNYTVTVNGQPVLIANNQPNPLRVSNTYHLNGEDAVIVTSYYGAQNCTYKNYLVTVHRNGTYAAPQEIGNCSGGYEAQVNNGVLLVNFPTKEYTTSSTIWDTWRYQAAGIAHM